MKEGREREGEGILLKFVKVAKNYIKQCSAIIFLWKV